MVICTGLCQFMFLHCSHARSIFDKQDKVHGIELYYYKNQYSVFSNISEYPPNVAYNAYDFKYGLINETSNMPMGKYDQ